MKHRTAAALALLGMIAGCRQILGLNGDPVVQTSSSSSGTTSNIGGGGEGPSCDIAACKAKHAGNPCVSASCSPQGVCETEPIAAGPTPSDPSPNDCRRSVCDGKGVASEEPDPTDHTNDELKNGPETDVDCGGGCVPCVAGMDCKGDGDCESGVCKGGKCQQASCSDDVKNGGETDVDCGAACGVSKLCADGESCADRIDCQSDVCGPTGVCEAPACDDGVENGSETGVDCGGTCGSCSLVLVLAAAGSGGALAGEYHPGELSPSWSVTTINGTAPDLPALALTRARVGVGVVRDGGVLHFATWKNGQSWLPSFLPVPSAKPMQGRPAITSDSVEALVAYHADSDFYHYHACYLTGSGVDADTWTVAALSTGKYGPSAPSIAALSDGAGFAFYWNTSNGNNVNHLAFLKRTNSTWQSPVDLAKELAPTMDDVFASQTDFAISPVIAAMLPGSPPSSTDPELMIAFVRASNIATQPSVIMTVTRDKASTWSSPIPVTSATTGEEVALLGLPNGEALLAYRSLDPGHSLFTARHKPATGWSSPVQLTITGSPVSIAAPPALAQGAAGKLAEMAYVTAAGAVFHTRYDGVDWSEPVQVGTPLGPGTRAAITAVP